VLDGDPAPSAPLKFSAHFYCDQTAGYIKMPLIGMEVCLSPWDFVLDWDQPPLQKGGGPPSQFSAHVYCGQTAGWIKMALGMEVGIGPGHIVLDWNPAPVPKTGGRGSSPIFGPRLLWPNGCMDQDALVLSRRRPTRHCVRWGPNSPSPLGEGELGCEDAKAVKISWGAPDW